MPFTISHAAAVLPFSRWLKSRQLLSAAVIGSMAPDFGVFLPLHLPRAETHTIARGAGKLWPSARQPSVYWLRASAFIGLPCPTKIAGMRNPPWG